MDNKQNNSSKDEQYIIVVDNEEKYASKLAEALKKSYSVKLAVDDNELEELLIAMGNKALLVIMAYSNNIINHDKEMKNSLISKISGLAPIVLVVDECDKDVESLIYNKYSVDVIKIPYSLVIAEKRISNLVELFNTRRDERGIIEEQTMLIKKQYIVLKKQADKLKNDNYKIIDTLAAIVEFRNLESRNHINRIKGYTRELAICMSKINPEYGITKEKLDIIVAASALHDVGKISVPDYILLKPSKLTPDEYEVMKSHATKGSEVIDEVGDFQGEEYYQAAYEICRHHHERYDGSGYPDNLRGGEIPIAAQIVAIADVYDALVNDRVYRSAYSYEDAFEMIIRGECGVFSPEILECVRLVRRKFENIATNNKG